jgi:hypothetical protein
MFSVVNRNHLEAEEHKRFRNVMNLLKNHLEERGYYYGQKI